MEASFHKLKASVSIVKFRNVCILCVCVCVCVCARARVRACVQYLAAFCIKHYAFLTRLLSQGLKKRLLNLMLVT